jgi:hypothetical protein
MKRRSIGQMIEISWRPLPTRKLISGSPAFAWDDARVYASESNEAAQKWLRLTISRWLFCAALLSSRPVETEHAE